MPQDTASGANALPKVREHFGERRRVGGIGHIYRVIGQIDDRTAMIHLEKTGEDLRYPWLDVERDSFASDPPRPDMARYAELIGQYRTIGTAGPTYEVTGIVDEHRAKIWIVAEEGDEDYPIDCVLLDPMHVD